MANRKMKSFGRTQSGFGLTQLLAWGILLGLCAVIAMKAVPSFLNYQTVMKTVKRIAGESNASTTVQQVKSAFSKQMEIEYVRNITADDLDIYKENGQIVIAFALNDKIPLFGPVSLLIEYKGESKGAD